MSQDIDLHNQLQTPVAVLFGGHSAEREVSLQSGAAILAAFQAQNIPVEAIDTQDDDWLERVTHHHRHAFIALHGGDGEDGTVQGALENIDVSYTGSGVAASALAMDKVRCKYLWQGMDLPTPLFAELNDESDVAEIIQQFGKVIVKPSCEGSSIGMTIATTAEELSAAYLAARAYDDSVMVEQWVQGAEFTVAILGGRALPAIRLETDHGFYDYDAKYIADDTRYICPCGLENKLETQLQELALAAFSSVGCEGWGRVDVMQDEQGNFYLLEVNTVPGMTSHSLVPMAAKAAGLSFKQLVKEILTLSLK
ncbi:D-alanine--D-alanine ligase [Oceanicoccus sagamiensis]|uniref:D-alanine--D-alanine ligase n=1 Tax=Oceanicoccus sagamiensis TaxID=716816 RepID=A0A1X9NC21_9GAMM|nr:D-alanine--D-alanine ligase [Oceanicoccus sagamiensis]ARN74721.1 D-alanine--D-alanine ligase [Oceanicoccus sagamiensis]